MQLPIIHVLNVIGEPRPGRPGPRDFADDGMRNNLGYTCNCRFNCCRVFLGDRPGYCNDQPFPCYLTAWVVIELNKYVRGDSGSINLIPVWGPYLSAVKRDAQFCGFILSVLFCPFLVIFSAPSHPTKAEPTVFVLDRLYASYECLGW